MTNEAVSPMPRRARTAAAAHPPRIALDIARVVAASAWVADTLDCCPTLTARTVCDHLLAHLDRDGHTPLPAALADAATLYLRSHLNTHTSVTDNPNALCYWLTDDVVHAQLTAYLDAVVEPDTLEPTITTVTLAGFDGELIAWEVINRESIRHEGLIFKECNRLVRTLPDRAADDLKGYGWAGLRVALRNYDPALGFAFSTYACPRINGAIRDGVRAESPIPKRLTTFVRKVSAVEETLTQKLGRTPSYSEIAAELDESIAAMTLLRRLAPSASLEELSNPWGEGAREPSCLVDDANPEAEVVTAARNAALHAAVQALPDDEATAVRLLMLEEMPVGEAAALVGVDARQLRARKQRGIKLLSTMMAPWLEQAA